VWNEINEQTPNNEASKLGVVVRCGEKSGEQQRLVSGKVECQTVSGEVWCQEMKREWATTMPSQRRTGGNEMSNNKRRQRLAVSTVNVQSTPRTAVQIKEGKVVNAAKLCTNAAGKWVEQRAERCVSSQNVANLRNVRQTYGSAKRARADRKTNCKWGWVRHAKQTQTVALNPP